MELFEQDLESQNLLLPRFTRSIACIEYFQENCTSTTIGCVAGYLGIAAVIAVVVLILILT